MTPEQAKALMGRATRPRRTVPVVLDGDLRERIEALQGEIAVIDVRAARDKRQSTKDPAAELEAQLEALHEQAADATVLVVLEGLDCTAFRAFLAKYPPKPGEDGVAPTGFDAFVDREASEADLILASVIGMRLSLDSDKVEELPDGWVDWFLDWATADQRETLWLAAWACSRGPDAVPLRRARSRTASSDSA